MGNWIPKSIIKGIDSNGNKIRLEEWNVGDLGNGELLELSNFIFPLLIGFIFSSIVSPIFLLISILIFKGKVQTFNIIGIISGIYFLLDMYNNWLGNIILGWVCSQTTMVFLVSLTTGAVIGHILLFLFLILFGSSSFKNNKIILLSTIIIFSLFGFFYGNNLGNKHGSFNTNIINKEKNINIENSKTYEEQTGHSKEYWDKQEKEWGN